MADKVAASSVRAPRETRWAHWSHHSTPWRSSRRARFFGSPINSIAVGAPMAGSAMWFGIVAAAAAVPGHGVS